MLLFVILVNSVNVSHGLSWALRKLPCDVISTNTSVYFHCSGRKLAEVPTLPSWNVTHLDLSDNRIRNVTKESLCNLRNLTLINISGNEIITIEIDSQDVPVLNELKTLLLDGNHLLNVPKHLPVGLQSLGLSRNKIKSIGPEDFKSVLNIEVINLNANCYYYNTCNGPLVINNGTFSGLIQLTNLTISGNRLPSIPPHLPKSLLLLNMRRNTIQRVYTLDLQNFTKLRTLDLSGNCPSCYNAPFTCTPCKNGSMEIDPEAFSGLSQLQELRLSGNSLQTINPSLFKGLTKLKYLYLSFNSLLNEIETGEFLSVLPQVEVMDLSFNNARKSYSSRLTISEKFSQLKSLKSLHLESYFFYVTLCEMDLSPLYSLKNLSVLNLRTNFIQQTNLSLFQNFYNLSVISLSENMLTFSSRTADIRCKTVCEDHRDHGFEQVEGSRSTGPIIHYDGDFGRYPPFIKTECLATGSVFDLSRNNIFYINQDLYHGVENTTCLNLSSNSIYNNFNGTEFVNFPKLKYLDLSYNKVYLCSEYAFNELKELEVLDLSDNKHYFEVAGINHSLVFLKHLEFLKVLNVSWNEISTLTDKNMTSSSLRELQFQGNRLDIMWGKDRGFISLFKHLTNLTSLDLSYNKLHKIPPEVYNNFPKTLTYLGLSRNRLNLFEWENLIHLPKLEELDLSKNELEIVSQNVSAWTSTLRVLNLRHNKISQLADNFLMGAKSLEILDLSYNHLSMINQVTFQSGPGNFLRELSLETNPFHCTCDLLDFILWLETNDVELPRLYTGVLCDVPDFKRGKSIIDPGINIKGTCMNSDWTPTLYAVSSSLVILTLSVAFTMHLFYWDVSYVLNFCRAKIKYRQLRSADCIYDAFIMYDTKDPLASDWVLNRLRVELEERGERVRPLCLEERDWTPGTPIMENLSQSVRWSRKTIFVLTEGFVCSGIFKMAAFLAQQRLLEEGVDVMVLLLLEPVLRRSRILHLRRRLCQRSVLEWPRNPDAESWFWQSLRNAIRLDSQGLHSKLYKNYFTSR